MTIEELLKREYGARVTNGHRWLVWQNDAWVVYERLAYQKKSRFVIVTDDFKEAVGKLRSDDEMP